MVVYNIVPPCQTFPVPSFACLVAFSYFSSQHNNIMALVLIFNRAIMMVDLSFPVNAFDICHSNYFIEFFYSFLLKEMFVIEIVVLLQCNWHCLCLFWASQIKSQKHDPKVAFTNHHHSSFSLSRTPVQMCGSNSKAWRIDFILLWYLLKVFIIAWYITLFMIIWATSGTILLSPCFSFFYGN